MTTTSPPAPSYTKTWHSASYPAISPARPELSAKNKNAIITGAGSGIGARTALSFAEAGASNIALLGRTMSKLVTTKEAITEKYPAVNVHILVVDITDRQGVKKAISTFSNLVGKINVLINSAGYLAAASPIDSLDLDEFFLSLDVNVKGSVTVATCFAQVAATDAVLVNIASNVSYLPFAPGYSSYAVSKAAVVRLFDYIQHEQPEWRVYNVQPGTIDTPMTRKGGIPPSDDGMLHTLNMRRRHPI